MPTMRSKRETELMKNHARHPSSNISTVKSIGKPYHPCGRHEDERSNATEANDNMKLHWSPRSPYVRKVMIAAHEIGIADRLNCVRTVVFIFRPAEELFEYNPLNKLPTLELDDGTALFDNRVICEYLDSLHAGRKLFPASGAERIAALRHQGPGGRHPRRLPDAARREAEARGETNGLYRRFKREKDRGSGRSNRERSRRAHRSSVRYWSRRDWVSAWLSGFSLQG
jgi:glutathione S-transferase